jgi:hypothetical protein
MWPFDPVSFHKALDSKPEFTRDELDSAIDHLWKLPKTKIFSMGFIHSALHGAFAKVRHYENRRRLPVYTCYIREVRRTFERLQDGPFEYMCWTPLDSQMRARAEASRNTNANIIYLFACTCMSYVHRQNIYVDWESIDWNDLGGWTQNAKMVATIALFYATNAQRVPDYKSYFALREYIGRKSAVQRSLSDAPQTMLIVCSNPAQGGSDAASFGAYVAAARILHLRVCFVYESKVIRPNDNEYIHISAHNLDLSELRRYKVAVHAIVSTAVPPALVASGMAEHNIACAGHTMSSGLPAHRLIPDWDDVDTYCETPHPTDTMACWIPNKRFSPNLRKIKATTIGIVFTKLKGANTSFDLIKRLKTRIPEHVDVYLLMGSEETETRKVIVSMLMGHVPDNWHVIWNDGPFYEWVMCNATFVVGSFPYNGFVTASDAVCHGTPMFVQYAEDCYGHQCSYRILREFGLHQLCFKRIEDMVDSIVLHAKQPNLVAQYRNAYGRHYERVESLRLAHNERVDAHALALVKQLTGL